MLFVTIPGAAKLVGTWGSASSETPTAFYAVVAEGLCATLATPLVFDIGLGYT
jgi:hypothetical protein